MAALKSGSKLLDIPFIVLSSCTQAGLWLTQPIECGGSDSFVTSKARSKRWVSSALFFWYLCWNPEPPCKFNCWSPHAVRKTNPYEEVTCWHCSLQPKLIPSWPPLRCPVRMSLQMAELSFYCNHLRDLKPSDDWALILLQSLERSQVRTDLLSPSEIPDLQVFKKNKME